MNRWPVFFYLKPFDMRISSFILLSFLFVFFSGCAEDDDARIEPTPEATPEITLLLDGEETDYPFAYTTDVIAFKPGCPDGDCPEVNDQYEQTLYLSTEDVLENGELTGTSDAVIIKVISSSQTALENFEYDFNFGFNWLPEGGVIAVGFQVETAYDFSTRTSTATKRPQSGWLNYLNNSPFQRRAYMNVNLGNDIGIKGFWSGNPIRITE